MESLGWSLKYLSALTPWREKSINEERKNSLPIFGRIIYEETLEIPAVLSKIRCQGKKLKRVLVETVDMKLYHALNEAKAQEREIQKREIEEGKRTRFSLHYSRKRKKKLKNQDPSFACILPTTAATAPAEIHAQFFIAYAAVHSEVGSFVRMDLLRYCMDSLKLRGMSGEGREKIRKRSDGIMFMSTPNESAVRTFIKNNVSERIDAKMGVGWETAELFRLFGQNLFQLHTMKNETRKQLYADVKSPPKLAELCLDSSNFNLSPLPLKRYESWLIDCGWVNNQVEGVVPSTLLNSAIELLKFITDYIRKQNCDFISNSEIPAPLHDAMPIIYRAKKIAYNQKFKLFYPRPTFEIILQCIHYLKHLKVGICYSTYPYSTSFVTQHFNDLQSLAKNNTAHVFVDAFTWIERGPIDGINGLEMWFSSLHHRSISVLWITRAHFLRLAELRFFLKNLYERQVRIETLAFMYDPRFKGNTIELVLHHYAKSFECGGGGRTLDEANLDMDLNYVSTLANKVDLDIYFALSDSVRIEDFYIEPTCTEIEEYSSKIDIELFVKQKNAPILNFYELLTILNGGGGERTEEQNEILFSTMYSTLDCLLAFLKNGGSVSSSTTSSTIPPIPNRFINCTMNELVNIFHEIRTHGKTLLLTFDEKQKLHFDTLLFTQLESKEQLNRVKAKMYSNFQYMDLKTGQLGKFFRLTEEDRQRELKVHRQATKTLLPLSPSSFPLLPCQENNSCCLKIFQKDEDDFNSLSTLPANACTATEDDDEKQHFIKRKKFTHGKKEKGKGKGKGKSSYDAKSIVTNWWFTTNYQNPYNGYNLFRFREVECRLVPAEALTHNELHCEVDFLIIAVNGDDFAKGKVLPQDVYRAICFARKHVIFATV